jgi:uncharacterized protein YkwD
MQPPFLIPARRSVSIERGFPLGEDVRAVFMPPPPPASLRGEPNARRLVPGFLVRHIASFWTTAAVTDKTSLFVFAPPAKGNWVVEAAGMSGQARDSQQPSHNNLKALLRAAKESPMKRFVTCVIAAVTVSAALSTVIHAQTKKKLLNSRVHMLQLTNDFRAQNGASPLRSSTVLKEVAARYVMVVANKDRLSHSLDGSNVGERLGTAGYTASRWGENLASFKHDPTNRDPYATAIEMWKNSPGHRANMLKPEFTEMAVGVAYKNGKYYFCQVFAKDLRPFPANSGIPAR